jgi:plasmid maintenance system antidote protein VapI
MSNFDIKRRPTHPGEIIKEEFMIPLKLTQTELSKAS